MFILLPIKALAFGFFCHHCSCQIFGYRIVHGQGIRGSSRHFTLKEIGEIRRTLLTLERDGLAYNIKRSKPRWFPTSHVVALHGFAEGSQTSLMRWL